jgi:hypothetical protein
MTFRERCALTALTEALRVPHALRSAAELSGDVWDVADAMEEERAKRQRKTIPAVASTCAVCSREFASHKPMRFCSRECFEKECPVAETHGGRPCPRCAFPGSDLLIHQDDATGEKKLCGSTDRNALPGAQIVNCPRCLDLMRVKSHPSAFWGEVQRARP